MHRWVGLGIAVLCSFAFLGLGRANGSTLETGTATAPTIVSDQPDYAPGSTVTLTGAGWQPAENVHIDVDDDQGHTWSYAADAVAADDGTITNTFQLPNWFVASYSVIATGPISGIATTTFTDGNITLHGAAPTPVSWTVDYDTYSTTSCTTKTGSGSVTISGAGPAQVGSNPAGVKVTSVQPGAGWAFDGWTLGTNQMDNGTPPPANGCFAGGPGNATDAWAHFHQTDTTPPVSTASAAGYTSGTWSNAASVVVTITATDNVAVQSITYSTNGGSPTTVSGSTATVTVTAEGTTTIAYHATDTNGNVESPGHTFVVELDRTAPTIGFVSRTPVANANGWNNTNVAVSWSCADALSGPTAPSASATLSTEGANQSATGLCTDLAGNAATNTQTGINIDRTAPYAPSAALSPTPNGTGWTTGDTTVSFTGNGDGGVAPSGVASCTGPTTISTETSGTVVSGTCTDKAGNVSAASSATVQLDRTAPSIVATASTPSGQWTNQSVTVHFTCTDALSGVVACPADVTTSSDGVATVARTVSDNAGNTATSNAILVQVDTAAPTISYTGQSPATNGNGWNNTDVTLSWTCADALSGPVAPSVSSTATSEGTAVTRTGTCTDLAGNSTSDTRTVQIDKVAPTITATAMAGAAPYVSGTWTNQTVTIHYTCSDALSGVAGCPADDVVSGDTPLSGVTVSRTVADRAGNVAASAPITVKVDTTPPVLSGVSGDLTAEATSSAGSVVSYTAPTAVDAVDGTVSASCAPASGSTFALGATTVTCSTSDSLGNTASATFTVTVVDTTPPRVAPPVDVTAEAAGPGGAAVNYGLATSSDLVDGAGGASCAPISGSVFAIGATTVTCSATDVAGNIGTATFTVTVQDTTPPALSLPADIVQEAVGRFGNLVVYSATASDLVDGPLVPACVPASTTMFPIGVATVDCSVTDAHGNTSSGSFSVTIADTTPPALSLPGDITAEATGPAGAAVGYSASATDAVDLTDAVDCAPASGSTFPLGTTTVHCSSTDANHNTSTGTFVVTVHDTTPPVLTTSSDLTAEATGATGAVVTYDAAAASDVVDGAVAASCSPASGSTFALGTTTVTCSATDAHGNTGAASFTVKVQDTTPPALTVPSSLTLEATGPSGAVATFGSSASDIVDGALPTTCSPASGSTFALGTTTVSCSATDAAGNTGTATFTVKVQDTTPPSVTVPSSLTLEATAADGAVATFSSSASDIVDGALPTTCSPASGSTFALGTTTVTCSATDAHGNTGHASFTVKVQDTTPPALTVPSSLTLEATGPHGAVATFGSSASDIVDGTVATTCSPASGSTFAIQTTTVTCSATDAHGNTGHASFTVKVQDTTAPTVTVPADRIVEGTSPAGAAVTYSASAADVVDGTDPVSCSPASGSTFALGRTTVNCSATDAHGNTGSTSFAVTVVDTTPPTVAIAYPSAAGSYTATGAIPWSGSLSGTAADTASGVSSVQVSVQRSSDGLYWNGASWAVGVSWLGTTGTTTWTFAFPTSAFSGDGSYVVRAKSTDASNNVSSVASTTFTMNVTPTVGAGGPYSGVEGSAIALAGTATDAEALTYAWTSNAPAGRCTFGSPTSLATTFTCNDNGGYTVTLTVRDGINGPVTSSASVTVNDAPPAVTISSPANGTIYGLNSSVGATAKYTDAGAADGPFPCSINWGDGSAASTGTVTVLTASSGLCNGNHMYTTAGTFTITFTVMDKDGVAGQATVNVTITTTSTKK